VQIEYRQVLSVPGIALAEPVEESIKPFLIVPWDNERPGSVPAVMLDHSGPQEVGNGPITGRYETEPRTI
jgi:hypothetical protein